MQQIATHIRALHLVDERRCSPSHRSSSQQSLSIRVPKHEAAVGEPSPAAAGVRELCLRGTPEWHLQRLRSGVRTWVDRLRSEHRSRTVPVAGTPGVRTDWTVRQTGGRTDHRSKELSHVPSPHLSCRSLDSCRWRRILASRFPLSFPCETLVTLVSLVKQLYLSDCFFPSVSASCSLTFESVTSTSCKMHFLSLL